MSTGGEHEMLSVESEIVLLACSAVIAALLRRERISFRTSEKRRARLHSLIRNTPVSSIHAAEPGPVRIRGRISAAAHEILVSPWTRKECVAYTFHVSEDVGEVWTDLVKETRNVDHVLIKDETGVAELSLDNARFSMKSVASCESGFGKSAPDELEALLQKRYSKSSKTWLGLNRSTNCTERVLEVGDEVHVFGKLEQSANRKSFDPDYPHTLVTDGENDGFEGSGSNSLSWYIDPFVWAEIAVWGFMVWILWLMASNTM